MGNVYERIHFTGSSSASQILLGFIIGYDTVTDDTASCIAKHAGVYLICWYTRRAPHSPLQYPLEKVTSLIEFGRVIIMKGWERDGTWLENSMMRGLFRGAGGDQGLYTVQTDGALYDSVLARRPSLGTLV